jgi:aspartate carbamoyltransferase catalytic subunit|uniref:Aspartate carbamoyltransferase n=1 Tax=candidate division WOR-3 bacterium TaxID=2052148 RepID=A0A7C6AAH7_UNCW3
MKFSHKNLLGIAELSQSDILTILNLTNNFRQVLDRPIPIVPALRGKTIVNLFFEPSTRTATSFAIAAKRLSADIVNFAIKSSSVIKGETLLDTAKNIEAMKVDGVVIRSSYPGAAHFLAKHLKAFVVNAGDGAHEHPTQALSDIYTISQRIKKFPDLKVLIVGDITHSRVARSDILAFSKLGAKVAICGPPTLIPIGIEKTGCEIFYKLDHILSEVDVVVALRLQRERQQVGLFPSIREYRALYGLTKERLLKLRRPLIIMHPGPINWGVELDPAVATTPHSVVLEQVKNGVAVRMAVLYALAGGETDAKG